MVFQDAWELIDLEGQHPAAAAAAPKPEKGLVALVATLKPSQVMQRDFWNRRRLLLVLLLLAVLALALGLGIGLGTKGGAAGGLQ
jgi:hypothetical protein